MKTLVIKEKRWLRAGRNGGIDFDLINNDDPPKGLVDESVLYSARNNRMCCLGFASRQCGIKVADIRELHTPHDLSLGDRAKLRAELPWLLDELDENSVEANKLMAINDSELTTLSQKRSEIKKIFKRHGIKVVFEK